jgi:hypothetical protein
LIAVETIEDGDTDTPDDNSNTNTQDPAPDDKPCGAGLTNLADLPPPQKDKSHLAFSLTQSNVDPCSVEGFVVGSEEQKLVNAGNGIYYIPDVPAGSYDVILQADGAPLEDGSTSNPSDIAGANLLAEAKKFGRRVNRVTAISNKVVQLDKDTKLDKVGSVTGIALLDGTSDNSGILVAIPGTHWSAITDDDGSYTIPNVVPGTHDFRFFKDQYIPGRIGEATVEADTKLTLPNISLYLNSGETTPLIPSPDDSPSSDLSFSFGIKTSASPIKMKVSLDPTCANTEFLPFKSNASIEAEPTDAISNGGYGTIDVYVCIIDRDNTPSTISSTFTVDIFGTEGEAPTFSSPATLSRHYAPEAVFSEIDPAPAGFSLRAFSIDTLDDEEDALADPSGFRLVTGAIDETLKVSLGTGDDKCGDHWVFLQLVSPDGYKSAARRQQVNYECWESLDVVGKPDLYSDARLVWAGDRLIAKGLGVSSFYDPLAREWSALPTTDAPGDYKYPLLYSYGSKVVVFWGSDSGNVRHVDGSIYDPKTNTWDPIPELPESVAPNLRIPTVRWLDDRIFYWGGEDDSLVDQASGAIYLPAAKLWQPISQVNAPEARHDQSTIWTGSRVVVFGGRNEGGTELDTGAIYNPYDNTWTATPTLNAPTARGKPAIIKTDAGNVIIYSGDGLETTVHMLTSIDASPEWVALPDTSVTGGRDDFAHSDFIGDKMVFFSRWDYGYTLSDLTTAATVAPPGCSGNSQLSGGRVADQMILWPEFCDASRYDPENDTWAKLPSIGAPIGSSSSFHIIEAGNAAAILEKNQGSSGVAAITNIYADPIQIAWVLPNDRDTVLVVAGEDVGLGMRVLNAEQAQSGIDFEIIEIRGPATASTSSMSIGAATANTAVDVAADDSMSISVADAAKTGATIEMDLCYTIDHGTIGVITKKLIVGSPLALVLANLAFTSEIGADHGATEDVTVGISNIGADTATITDISFSGSSQCITSLGDLTEEPIAPGGTLESTVSITTDSGGGCLGDQGILTLDVTFTDTAGNSSMQTITKSFLVCTVIIVPRSLFAFL